MSEPELNACPWHADSVPYVHAWQTNGHFFWVASVRCPINMCRGPIGHGVDKQVAESAAIAAWNSYSVATRPPNVSQETDSAPISGELPADCTPKGIVSPAEARDEAMDAG